MNLYAFLENDPIENVDKLGLEKDRACVKRCHELYGWDFGIGTGIGGGKAIGDIPHKGPKGKPRIPIRGGRLTAYGRGLCGVGVGLGLGFLADNVGPTGGIALQGCLAGCPEQKFWVDPNSPIYWPILYPDPLYPSCCKRNRCD